MTEEQQQEQITFLLPYENANLFGAFFAQLDEVVVVVVVVVVDFRLNF